jgi:geranylgeranyl diphosphate synthase type II
MTDRFSDYTALIESTLPTLLNNPLIPASLAAPMRYAVMAGGKRIRPLLTLLTAELLADSKTQSKAKAQVQAQSLKTACAIEMIHTYSLIHDDLPSMDDDELRRGKPTVHIQFDEALAILAGDALQSLAFEIITNDEQLSERSRLNLVRNIAKAIGPTGMVAGQVLDMAAENMLISADQLTEMHNRKTGDLIAASVMAGAEIVGASHDAQTHLGQFGYNLGLAFQVRDDLLDVLSDTATLGKPQGSDERQDKSTFTTIFGVEGAKDRLDELHNSSLAALEPFGSKAEPLRALTNFVVARIH